MRIDSERLVSFTQRAVAAIHYQVEPLDEPLQLLVQSELLANEPGEESADPRAAAALQAPLVPDAAPSAHYRAVLAHHTRRSGLRMAAAMDHHVHAPDRLRTRIEADGDSARLTVSAVVPVGKRLRITKYLAYGW